jgi:riboflavin kinase / FMN adenylyltransferase
VNVIRGLTVRARTGPRVTLAHGNFDGVHLGHQAVIAETIRAARRAGGEAAALTFDPHPQHVIAPERKLLLLTTIDERLDLFAQAGLDTAIVAAFDDAVRGMRAVEWLALLKHHLDLQRIVVSSSHTFGHDREGTASALSAWGREHDVDVTVVQPVLGPGGAISSSAIRAQIAAGNLSEAAAALGRWYAVTGVVRAGDGRGRQLGFPTANVEIPENKLIPPIGVYAGYAQVGNHTYMAAVSIGIRPTFGAGPLLVEAFLLDADMNVYGETLRIAFVRRLRDELRFTSVEALVEQMRQDVVEVRAVLQEDRSLRKV